MSSAKREVASLLDSFPEDSSFEDIQYHLYVLEKMKGAPPTPNPKAWCHTKAPKPTLENGSSRLVA